MKLLYFLEPYVELERPLFRMGTIRNHLDHEIRSILLASRGPVEVMLMCSEHIAAEIRSESYLPGVPLAVIHQEELQRIYPSYLEASSRWYNRTYRPAEARRHGGAGAQQDERLPAGRHRLLRVERALPRARVPRRAHAP